MEMQCKSHTMSDTNMRQPAHHRRNWPEHHKPGVGRLVREDAAVVRVGDLVPFVLVERVVLHGVSIPLEHLPADRGKDLNQIHMLAGLTWTGKCCQQNSDGLNTTPLSTMKKHQFTLRSLQIKGVATVRLCLDNVIHVLFHLYLQLADDSVHTLFLLNLQLVCAKQFSAYFIPPCYTIQCIFYSAYQPVHLSSPVNGPKVWFSHCGHHRMQRNKKPSLSFNSWWQLLLHMQSTERPRHTKWQ